MLMTFMRDKLKNDKTDVQDTATLFRLVDVKIMH